MDTAADAFAWLVRHYRQAAGSQTQCAQAIGYSVSYLSMIETGKRAPWRRPDVVADLDEGLGAGGTLIAMAQVLNNARPRGVSLTTEPVDSMDGMEACDVERRELLRALGMTGAAGVAGTFGYLDAIRATLEDALDRSVDEWQEVAWDYSRDVLTMAPADLLDDLGPDVLAVRRLLDRTASAGDRASLQRVAAQLSALVALTFGNLGETSRARGWWRTASTAADRSGDPDLRAHVRGWRLVEDLHYGTSPDDVAAAADRTLRAIPSNGAGRMTVLSARAQGRALAGDPSATRVVDEQSDAFAGLPEDTDRSRSSFWGWAEQRLHFVRSYVYTCLGDSRAPAACDAALVLYPQGLYQEPAQVKLYRAGWMVRTGDPSEGLRHATRTVTELPRAYRDHLVIGAARDVARALPAEAEATPEAVEYRELLAAPTST